MQIIKKCTVNSVPAYFYEFAKVAKQFVNHTKPLADFQINKIRDSFKNGVVIVPNDCTLQIIEETKAVVSFMDGTIHYVDPEDVVFTDMEGEYNG